jgi:hypothetical protein
VRLRIEPDSAPLRGDTPMRRKPCKAAAVSVKFGERIKTMKQKFPPEARAEVTSQNVDLTHLLAALLQIMAIQREHGSLGMYLMRKLHPHLNTARL